MTYGRCPLTGRWAEEQHGASVSVWPAGLRGRPTKKWALLIWGDDMGSADHRGRTKRLLIVLAAWSLLPIIAGSVVPGSAVAAATHGVGTPSLGTARSRAGHRLQWRRICRPGRRRDRCRPDRLRVEHRPARSPKPAVHPTGHDGRAAGQRTGARTTDWHSPPPTSMGTGSAISRSGTTPRWRTASTRPAPCTCCTAPPPASRRPGVSTGPRTPPAFRVAPSAVIDSGSPWPPRISAEAPGPIWRSGFRSRMSVGRRRPAR